MRKRKWTREEVWDWMSRQSRWVYCNRADGNLFIRKRWGLSWTLNWGNPLSWAVTGLFLLFLGAVLWFQGTLPRQEATSSPVLSSPSPAAPVGEAESIEELMAAMTLRQKVGQLFLVRPDALVPGLSPRLAESGDVPGATRLSPAMEAVLREYPVGGVVLFSKNLESPHQLTAFIREMQEASALPLFVGVDEEGGSIARLANHPAFDLPQYDSAGAVGASGDPDQALEMGRTIGVYLKEYGFNLDFAPVADVNTNPDNPVIGDRAFSSQAETAAAMAAAMARGLEEEGILPVFKHFPGHGDTQEDSHAGVAVSTKTLEELALCELLPFREAQADHGVMVGHIALPSVTGEMTLASLSPALASGLLQEELGFEGLVFTDSLSMGAITHSYTPGQAALAALEAGCDVLVMPYGLQDAFEEVLDAAEKGDLSRERLDQSVEKILRAKAAWGILELAGEGAAP